MAVVRLQERSAREIAYQRKLREILRQVDHLEEGSIKQVMAFLREARERIASSLASSTGFDAIHLQAIKREIETVVGELQSKYSAYFDKQLVKAWQTGTDIVELPLRQVGIDVGSSLAAVSREQLEVLRGFSADLVKDIAQTGLKRINSEIQLGILGQKSVNEVMKGVGRSLTSPGVFQNITSRAEVVTRTELNRVVNMATGQRVVALGRELPGLRKYWDHTTDSRTRASHESVGIETNPDFGGKPVPFDQDFLVGGEWASGPHDPRLSAAETIQCRCRLGIIPPEES